MKHSGMLILAKHRGMLSFYRNAFECVFFATVENRSKSSHFNPEEKVSIKTEVNRDLEVPETC